MPMIRKTALLLALLLSSTAVSAMPDQYEQKARAILRSAPVLDGHNDIPYTIREHFRGKLAEFDFLRLPDETRQSVHTDIERLRQGGVGGQFWSVFVPSEQPEPEALRMTLEQIDIARRLIAAYPDHLIAARSAADIERAMKSGRIASLLGAEGGHSIASSLGVLRQFHDLGVRYMTLTHNTNTGWADSATDAPRHGGLSPFGIEVVREMNRIGMLVDLSHVSAATMHDALDVAEAPVIFSHSSAFALVPHARNVPDDVLKRLPRNGGIIMISFIPAFTSNVFLNDFHAAGAAEKTRLEKLHPGDPQAVAAGMKTWLADHPAPQATLAQVADHIDHVRKLIGIDHIGIGSDFDGISHTPSGLDDAATYPALFAELLRRGYSPDDLRKIANGNILRVMRAAEATATRLAKSRPPAELGEKD